MDISKMGICRVVEITHLIKAKILRSERFVIQCFKVSKEAILRRHARREADKKIEQG